MAKIYSTIGLFASIDHNSTENIQGGSATERYHLTFEELEKLQNGATPVEDKNFIFNQGVPTLVWDFTHPLEKITSVTILDSAGTEIEARVRHFPPTRVVIEFSVPFSGRAVLN